MERKCYVIKVSGFVTGEGICFYLDRVFLDYKKAEEYVKNNPIKHAEYEICETIFEGE